MMEAYYSEHGARNPCFRYVIKVKTVSAEAGTWLKEYPSAARYWVDWSARHRIGQVTVQFEQEEPAVMFALRWGDD